MVARATDHMIHHAFLVILSAEQQLILLMG